MDSVKKKVSCDEAFVKLSTLCARAEYCESDMRKKMQRWDMPEGAEDEVINRLVAERYIDEERFARAFVREKFRFNRWGRNRISMELGRKGIARFVIEDALEEIPVDENLSSLKSLLDAKRRSVKGKNDYDVRCKLIRFALSRGFSMDDIGRVIDGCDELSYDENE